MLHNVEKASLSYMQFCTEIYSLDSFEALSIRGMGGGKLRIDYGYLRNAKGRWLRNRILAEQCILVLLNLRRSRFKLQDIRVRFIPNVRYT